MRIRIQSLGPVKELGMAAAHTYNPASGESGGSQPNGNGELQVLTSDLHGSHTHMLCTYRNTGAKTEKPHKLFRASLSYFAKLRPRLQEASPSYFTTTSLPKKKEKQLESWVTAADLFESRL